MKTKSPDKFEFLFAVEANESHTLFEDGNIALLVELHAIDPARYMKLWNHLKSAKLACLGQLSDQMAVYRKANPQKDASGFLLSHNGMSRQNIAANYDRALDITLNGGALPDNLDDRAIADLHMRASNALGFIPDRAVFEAVVRARHETESL